MNTIIIGVAIGLIIFSVSVYQIQRYAKKPSNGEVDTLKCLDDKFSEDILEEIDQEEISNNTCLPISVIKQIQ